jgi:hypothetical protein
LALTQIARWAASEKSLQNLGSLFVPVILREV